MSEIFEVLELSNNKTKSRNEREEKLEGFIVSLEHNIIALSEENRILKEKLVSVQSNLKYLSQKGIEQARNLLGFQE